MRLSQGLLLDMEILEKLFPYLKNTDGAFFYRNIVKDRMIHFNISIAVKL